METSVCKVCGNTTNNKYHQVKELQLGLREVFTYLECGNCGCMQLMNIPVNLGKYYPNEEYYSFQMKLDIRKKSDTLRHIKSSYLLFGKNKILGKLLSLGYKMPGHYQWVKNAGVKYDDPILDVGTGNGSLLLNLFKIGFTNLTGIDPFIEKDQKYGAINIYKKGIYDIQEKFALIMLHHAFEHMDEPLKVLLQLKKLLQPNKYILIRIPLMNMYGWKKYGLNWVGLDAPRHIIIHSIESMKILAEQSGLELHKVEFDSDPINIWASEQYEKDIALIEPNSYMVNKKTAFFTKVQIKSYKKLTKQINEKRESDQAAFYLFNRS